MGAAATIMVIIIVWSVVSGPLDRRGITSALFFTAAGFVVGASVLGWLDVSVESAVAERVTEIALVLLLFSDAARLDLRALRRELGWPVRLLLIGLPLTMVAGVGAGALVLPGHGAGVRVPALDHAGLDGRGARPEGRLRPVRAGPRPPGARRGERAQRRPRRALLPRRARRRQRGARRRGSPGPSSAMPPPRSAGDSPPGSPPASSAACCSAPPTAVGGSAASGGRSSRWRSRCWPTRSRCCSAAAASSPPSPAAWRSDRLRVPAARSSPCSRRRPEDS